MRRAQVTSQVPSIVVRGIMDPIIHQLLVYGPLNISDDPLLDLVDNAIMSRIALLIVLEDVWHPPIWIEVPVGGADLYVCSTFVEGVLGMIRPKNVLFPSTIIVVLCIIRSLSR